MFKHKDPSRCQVTSVCHLDIILTFVTVTADVFLFLVCLMIDWIFYYNRLLLKLFLFSPSIGGKSFCEDCSPCDSTSPKKLRGKTSFIRLHHFSSSNSLIRQDILDHLEILFLLRWF